VVQNLVSDWLVFFILLATVSRKETIISQYVSLCKGIERKQNMNEKTPITQWLVNTRSQLTNTF